MKVAILSNDDLTGSLIFSPVLDNRDVSVELVVFSKSPVKARKSMFSAALALRKRMAPKYWSFLVITNGLFSVYSTLTKILKRHPQYGDLASLEGHAIQDGIPVERCSDFNSDELKTRLRDLSVDLLLIRVSAILDREILAIPAIGTWCVHSSILPAYGGIAGEFQALREDQPTVGSTVFKVTEKLDEGPPLAQTSIPAAPGRSLFSHIVANNRAAGKLLSSMVSEVAKGQSAEWRLLNEGVAPSYYSWPDRKQVAEFRAKGRKLIGVAEMVRLGLSSLRLGSRFARFL